MIHLFTPLGVQGPLSAAIGATAHSLSSQKERIEACLNVFMSDEMLAWSHHAPGCSGTVDDTDVDAVDDEDEGSVAKLTTKDDGPERNTLSVLC